MPKFVLYIALALLTASVLVLQFTVHRYRKSQQNPSTLRTIMITTILCTLVFISLIEINVRLEGASHPDLFLFVHIGFGVIFLSSLLLLFWKFKNTQTVLLWVLYVNLIAFIGTFGLGIKLLSRL